MTETMIQSRISGILFDKDGTLFDFQKTWGQVIETVLDTLAPDRETWTRMARAGGYDPVRGTFVAGSPVVAESNGAIARLWRQFRPDLSETEIERVLDDTALDSLSDPDALFPATPDLPGLLNGLRGAGFSLGVATHDSELSAKSQLKAAGAIEAFDFVAGFDSGHGLKPGPGMLFAFARVTGITPDRIAMVGDSRHDLEAGLSAGAAATIGVLTGPATRADLKPFASHVIPSIADLPSLLATTTHRG